MQLGLSVEMEISGRAFAIWYYMEPGSLWWTNVLNSAVPPQRHRPDTPPEHQDPVSHTASPESLWRPGGLRRRLEAPARSCMRAPWCAASAGPRSKQPVENGQTESPGGWLDLSDRTEAATGDKWGPVGTCGLGHRQGLLRQQPRGGWHGSHTGTYPCSLFYT